MGVLELTQMQEAEVQEWSEGNQQSTCKEAVKVKPSQLLLLLTPGGWPGTLTEPMNKAQGRDRHQNSTAPWAPC